MTLSGNRTLTVSEANKMVLIPLLVDDPLWVFTHEFPLLVDDPLWVWENLSNEDKDYLS